MSAYSILCIFLLLKALDRIGLPNRSIHSTKESQTNANKYLARKNVKDLYSSFCSNICSPQMGRLRYIQQFGRTDNGYRFGNNETVIDK